MRPPKPQPHMTVNESVRQLTSLAVDGSLKTVSEVTNKATPPTHPPTQPPTPLHLVGGHDVSQPHLTVDETSGRNGNIMKTKKGGPGRTWWMDTMSPSLTRRFLRTTLFRRTLASSHVSSASTMHTVSLRFLPCGAGGEAHAVLPRCFAAARNWPARCTQSPCTSCPAAQAGAHSSALSTPCSKCKPAPGCENRHNARGLLALLACRAKQGRASAQNPSTLPGFAPCTSRHKSPPALPADFLTVCRARFWTRTYLAARL
jgi:hypothetical protein